MTDEAATLLIEVSPTTFKDYLILEKDKNTFYLMLKRALYGCIKSALLFWENLLGKLIMRGYELNVYDRCVANKIINNAQITIIWHVDDLKNSYVCREVLEQEIKWLELMYGPLAGSIGSMHTYLGMDMCFEGKRLKVSMIEYLQEIVEEFPFDLLNKAVTPTGPYLFDKDEDSILLNNEKSKIFHQMVAKVLWAAMRVRPDLLTTLSYLTCQVKAPDEDGMKKLVRMIYH
jgi:hypothetical protein